MGGWLEDYRERRRAGRDAQRLVRAEWKQVRRGYWRLLATLIGAATLGIGLVVALAAWMGAPEFVLGLLVGMGLGVVPLYVYLLMVSSGIAAREFGADAERWTATELRRLDPQRWRVCHDMPVRSGNVDHVAIGPGRVYAIEAKWTTARGRFRDGFARQAARQAAELRAELSRRGVQREVIALLVIWGKGVSVALGNRPELDHATQTRIMAGVNATDWLARMDWAAAEAEVDEEAVRVVQAIIDDEKAGQHSSS